MPKAFWAGISLCLIWLASCNLTKKPTDRSDFKVEDTAAVTKIFLADMNNHTVLLEKKENGWLVNGEYPARPELIQVLLETLGRLEVKQKLSQNAVEGAVKTLATNHHKVEIYLNGESKPYKVIYVGGPTQDHLGTYMLIEGAKEPYICYVPGERAYLTPRFTPIADEWRSRVLFDFAAAEQIASVKVENKTSPASSFELRYGKEKKFKLIDINRNQEVGGFDTLRAKDYLRRFKSLGFVRYTQAEDAHLDSLKAKYHLNTITVTATSGKVSKLQLFQSPLPPGSVDDIGNPITYDMDEMFGLVDDSVLVIAQYYTYDPITVPISWFFEEGPAGDPY